MRYPGSKARLAKHLLPVILRHKSKIYIEPFCGGCNMLDKVEGHRRFAYDSNQYIIALFKALQAGWAPPTTLTEGQYKDIKLKPGRYASELVAFAAIPCSFGGKWFGGYARNKANRNYADIGSRHLTKQIQKLQDVQFDCRHYSKVSIPPKSIVYCDPPYKNTMKYKDTFDHAVFFEWARKKSKIAYVYVSEYAAPDDFRCILGIPHKTTLDIGQHAARMERLFVYKGGLSDI